MKLKLVLTLAVALVVAAPASGHLVRPASRLKHPTLRQIERAQQTNLAHAQGAVRYIERHSTSARRLAGVQRELVWHRRAVVWLSRELRETQAKALATIIGHRSLWLCIHSGEGAWSSNTGNGFYGGLQMTYGWLGYIAGRASDLSPAQQMAAAEHGYRASGFSTAWLFGQWPQTAPPCL